MNKSKLLYWYWLRSIKKIGPFRIISLLNYLGSPEQIYQATYEDYLNTPNIGKGLAKSIDESKNDLTAVEGLLSKEIDIAEEINVEIVTLLDPHYPRVLKRESAVAPPIIYVRGSINQLSEQTIAIVGTRHSSREARQRAHDLAKEAALNNWQIISGLALGIDSSSHLGALDASGYTVAVLGCGVDKIYPSKNRYLFEEIIRNEGAIISEYPFGSPPKGDNLRKRNKIIIGLSQAVVVAECPIDSGALIAAKEAFDQVKPVFAFHLSQASKTAEGSMKLINKGDAKAIKPGFGITDLINAIQDFQKLNVGVLFDLDGVIIDSSRLSFNSLTLAVKEVDGYKPSKEIVNKYKYLSPRKALKQLSDSNIDILLAEFNKSWYKRYAKDIRSNPNLIISLNKLFDLNFPLGIVTSRNQDHTIRVIEKIGVTNLFNVITTWGDTYRHKPDPEPITKTLNELPNFEISVYVGDQPEDISAARNADVVSIGASWFLDESGKEKLRIANPDYFVEKPSELYNIVLKLKRCSWSKAIDNIIDKKLM